MDNGLEGYGIFTEDCMRIEKDNIVIRSATVDDAEQLNKWWNDGEVMEHAGFPNGLGESLEETISHISKYQGEVSQRCIIEIDGKPVGELNYNIKGDDIAYPGWKICDLNYQNQGYGSTIIKMLFEFIFTDEVINSNSPVEKIAWDTMVENKRAQYVYENKIGARKTGIEKNTWKDQLGNWRGAAYYEITREEFFYNDNESIEIKPYIDTDGESFINMFNSYFQCDLGIELTKSKMEEICSEIVDSVKNQIVYLDLIKVNNKSTGFIIYQIDSPTSDWCQFEGDGFIREMYITKERRNRGLGKLLVTHAEQSLGNRDIEQVYLTSDDSGEFWIKCGYEMSSEVGYKNQDPIYMKSIKN